MGKTTGDRDPLLVEVLAALGAVDLRESYLIDGAAPKKNFLHGTQCADIVTINPAPSIVSTLVHELVHVVRPQWSEKGVRRRTTQLVRQLSHDEVVAIYREYLGRKEGAIE